MNSKNQQAINCLTILTNTYVKNSQQKNPIMEEFTAILWKIYEFVNIIKIDPNWQSSNEIDKDP